MCFVPVYYLNSVPIWDDNRKCYNGVQIKKKKHQMLCNIFQNSTVFFSLCILIHQVTISKTRLLYIFFHIISMNDPFPFFSSLAYEYMEHWIFIYLVTNFLILRTKTIYCTDHVKLKISSVLSTNKFDIMELLNNLYSSIITLFSCNVQLFFCHFDK